MEQPTRHDGYTLVELLTVVVMLGILAAVAFPSFLGQRESAWRAAVTSDVRIAALQMESAGAGGTYPDDLAQTERSVLLTSAGAPVAVSPVSPGVSLGLGVDADDPGYCLCGYHEGLGDDPAAIYHSSSGGFVDVCPIDADVPACDRATLVAAQRFEGVTFLGTVCQDEVNGRDCEHGGTDHYARMMIDQFGGPITSGTLTFSDVHAQFDSKGTHGGWAVAYGTYGDHGNLTEGFTLQFDRGFNQFIVAEWSSRTSESRTQLVDLPDGWDLRGTSASHDSVEVDVRDGQLVLHVDGQQILTQDLGDVEGTFGIRRWHDTTVRYGDATLTVD